MLGGDNEILIIADDNINHLVDMYFVDKSMLPEYLRYISKWDVSRVTDMSFLFSPEKYSNKSSKYFLGRDSVFGAVKELKKIKNLALLNWDVSNVTNMSSMFRGCERLNHVYVKKWDTSNVRLMDHMFFGCMFFVSLMYKNGKDEYSYLNKLNVSNVTDMSYMFQGCERFNKPLDNWNVSNVTNMTNMFWYTNFNQNISKWNITKIKVEDMLDSLFSQFMAGLVDEDYIVGQITYSFNIDDVILEYDQDLYNSMLHDNYGIFRDDIDNQRIVRNFLNNHIELYLFYRCPIIDEYMPRIFENIHRATSRNAKLKDSIQKTMKKRELNREIEDYYMPPENMKKLIKMYTLPNGDISNEFFEHAPTAINRKRKTLYKRKYGIPDKYQSPPSSVSKSI
jgi:surface protein